MGHLRGQGVNDLREVRLAVVEDDGSVSVMRRSWAEPVMKADIDSHSAAQRDIDLQQRPASEGYTTTQESLG